MVNDWLDRNEPVRAIVSKMEGRNVSIDLYFYKPEESISTEEETPHNGSNFFTIKLAANRSKMVQDNISLAEEGVETEDFLFLLLEILLE